MNTRRQRQTDPEKRTERTKQPAHVFFVRLSLSILSLRRLVMSKVSAFQTVFCLCSFFPFACLFSPVSSSERPLFSSFSPLSLPWCALFFLVRLCFSSSSLLLFFAKAWLYVVLAVLYLLLFSLSSFSLPLACLSHRHFFSFSPIVLLLAFFSTVSLQRSWT